MRSHRSPFYSLKGASPHVVSRSSSLFVNCEPCGGSPLGDLGAVRGRPNTGHALPPLALLFPKGSQPACRLQVPSRFPSDRTVRWAPFRGLRGREGATEHRACAPAARPFIP